MWRYGNLNDGLLPSDFSTQTTRFKRLIFGGLYSLNGAICEWGMRKWLKKEFIRFGYDGMVQDLVKLNVSDAIRNG